ncbi:MAG TPA: DNA polymerase I [Dehalococcoidia bacterium]|nr:DNA polymerase I [Dehalococcoidia bacterium]
MTPSEDKPLLVLLDGHGIIHRAYHAFKEPLIVRRTGEVVTAAFGVAGTLLSVLEQLNPTHMAIALDPRGPTFRHELDITYKAQRVAAPEDLTSQIGRCVELIEAFNIPVFRVPGFEADDALGTLAREAEEQGIDTFIVSLDSDMLQLVGPHVRLFMLRPYQRDTVIYDEEAVRERYGFEPHQMADFKGLKGDVSDNIPGVPGVGEKTAVKLIQQFGSLEGVYEHLDEVEPEKLRDLLRTHEAQARHSKQMATIRTDVPLTLDLPAAHRERFDRQKVLDMFRDLEFRSLIPRIPESGVEAETQALPRAGAAGAETDYRTVFTEDDLRSLVQRLSSARDFTLDTETDDILPMRAPLVGMSVSAAAGEAYYIPVGHQPVLGQPEQLALSTVLSHLGPLLEDRSLAKTAHNGKYDMVVLANHGATVRNLAFDTMIAAYLLGEGGGAAGGLPVGGGSLSLKWLVSKRLGIEMTPITDLIGKAGPKQLPMSAVPIDRVACYACADADLTGRLREILEAELKQQNLWKLFAEVEMPLVPVLARMEMTGVALDVSVLREMSQQLAGQVVDLEKEVYDAVGHQFTIGSPQQLSVVLFEELGLPKSRRGKQGYSTDAQVLESLRGAHPVVDLVLQYRQLTKLKSTYIDTLPALVNRKTNRVHTSFNQTVAATGRLSSNDPNLQNIPVRSELGGQVRAAFIARDFGPEPLLLGADYSQVELRILAHLCRDPLLLQSFRDDIDIHAATASEIFGVSLDEVTPEMRRRAKVFNFGVLYGLTAFGLSQREGISREEAQRFIDTYFERYPRVKEWRDKTVAETRAQGYAETIMGRRRYIPEINANNPMVRAAAERMAINMPVQGTASDIIKVAMNRIDAELTERGLRTKMLLQVHDELIFEGPSAETDALREMVLRVMPASLDLDVPLKVDVKVGKNWGEI